MQISASLGTVEMRFLYIDDSQLPTWMLMIEFTKGVVWSFLEAGSGIIQKYKYLYDSQSLSLLITYILCIALLDLKCS